MRGLNVGNEYAQLLGRLYATPKAVLVAVVVSLLTTGGDQQNGVQSRFMAEWQDLYDNGIVRQKPRFPRLAIDRERRAKHGRQS